MGGAERVVFALGALGEAGQAAALAQRADAVAPAGEDLVRIGLVADVPDQAVVGRIEDIMQCHRQFDDAQSGTEMSARNRDRIDRFLAQFIGHLPQAAGLETSKLLRRMDLIEQGGLGRLGQRSTPVLCGGRKSDLGPNRKITQVQIGHSSK